MNLLRHAKFLSKYLITRTTGDIRLHSLNTTEMFKSYFCDLLFHLIPQSWCRQYIIVEFVGESGEGSLPINL